MKVLFGINMVDRINPLKLENPIDGTQYDPTPTELDPQDQ